MTRKDLESSRGGGKKGFDPHRKRNNKNGKFSKKDGDHNNNKNNNKNKKDHKKNNGITTHHVYGRNNKLEIKFDPTARREYLTGASQRKKDRRIFGLAMQKLKDRQAKVENRREEMDARKEQIEEAERLKEQSLYGRTNDFDESDDESESDNDNEDDVSAKNTEKNGKELINKKESASKVLQNNEATKKTETFQDEETKSQFGGDVIVTTTFGIPEEEDEAEDWKRQNKQRNKKNIDTEQRYNNSVQKYIAQVKGNLPNKRKKTQQNPFFANKKGNHGASGMKGMGSAKDLKLAQKTLKNARGKGSRGQQEPDTGRRGKGKRGRR